jgi:hypothetical protein
LVILALIATAVVLNMMLRMLIGAAGLLGAPDTRSSAAPMTPERDTLDLMGLIRNEALVQALIDIGVIPLSSTNVQIQTTAEPDGYVRLGFEHLDDDGVTKLYSTTRIIDAHARGLDRLNWQSLLSTDPELRPTKSRD